MTTPIWRPHPLETSYDFEILASDEDFAKGECVGWLEDFGYACYPSAIDVKTGNRERGGAYTDRVNAKLWVERVAGLAPAKPGDERAPFYYQGSAS